MGRITIENESENTILTLYEGQITKETEFSYFEKDSGAFSKLRFVENGIEIIRVFNDVKTTLYLADESHGSVESEYGLLPLQLSCLDYQKSEDRVMVKYCVSDTFIFTIEF